MGKKLIITEKPSVGRDYAQVLKVNNRHDGYFENDEYIVTWCFGHLVEMLYPEKYDPKYEKWVIQDLPFLPAEYKYGVVESAKKQYQLVNEFLHSDKVDIVYWAGDSGKEGQTIEENIRNYGGVRIGIEEKRVWVDSQTEEELLRGIREARPMSDYASLGKSGIMRAIEDYALGINFSRALSLRYAGLLNRAAKTDQYRPIAVGRVMTCVLGMVVDREREIRNFNDTPFYRVIGYDNSHIPFEYRAVEGSKYYNSFKLYKENGFKTEEYANELIEFLNGKKGIISFLDSKTTRKKASALYNLAELQADCSRIFKITPSQTLDVVQELYEKKLTTYPRTDARVLTTAVAKEIYKNITGLKNYSPVSDFANNILSNKMYAGIEKSQYTDDSKVTDHYAIIPTGYTQGINSLNDLSRKVYDLIARRFLAIFYPPAEYEQSRVTINVDTESLFASAKVLLKPGYMEITGIPKSKDSKSKQDKTEIDSESEEEGTDDEKKALVNLVKSAKVGDEIEICSYELKEGKTSPPKRYTSGTIILAMENAGNLIEDEELRAQIKTTGIGTAATRQGIIEKLDVNKYIEINKKTQVITPQNLGEMIYEVVKMTAPSLLNPQMTASWEKGLDGITNNTVSFEDYKVKLEDFVRTGTLNIINNDLGGEIKEIISPLVHKDAKMKRSLQIKCPMCQGELTTTPFGFGCNNYSNEENPCKFSVGKICGKSLKEEDFKDLILKGKTKLIKGFKSKNGKKFDAMLVLKEDKSIGFEFENNNSQSERIQTDIECPNCKLKLMKGDKSYSCECGLRLYHIVAKKELSETEVRELLTLGRTKKKVTGLLSKGGNLFDTVIKYKDGRTEFDFDAKEIEENKNEEIQN
ncbi:MAG: DNA topoisomerase [Lachnospiraceae bacterium]|nr:DNA topoisomerase [Lachnospiraceae bacterium]